MQTSPFPEIGGIVHLEHVNFVAPDQDLATSFFMGGLGFTRDPYKRTDGTNMGVNVGAQQFHLPRRGDQTPPFPGEIGLVVPDLADIKSRLARLQDLGRFDDTPFAVTDLDDGCRVVSPFGISLRLHSAGTIPSLRRLALAYVDIWLPRGGAEKIIQFYRSVMNCPAQRTLIEDEVSALVPAGPHQYLRYRERPVEDYDTHNFHIAVYVTHYNEIRERLSALAGFKGDGLDQVFLFDGVYDPQTGEKLNTLQHEIRGLYHPDFMRPLVNRWPLAEEPFSDQAAVMAAARAQFGPPSADP